MPPPFMPPVILCSQPQLQRITNDASVSREDYHSNETGWDLEGLRSDLQIYMTMPALSLM